MMTRRNYVDFAGLVNNALSDGLFRDSDAAREFVREMGDLFKADNQRFDRERFETAAIPAGVSLVKVPTVDELLALLAPVENDCN
jgi:hypothetical protein